MFFAYREGGSCLQTRSKDPLLPVPAERERVGKERTLGTLVVFAFLSKNKRENLVEIVF